MDFQNIDLQKEVNDLKKLSGEERGEDIKYLVSYIKKNKGEEGFKKVEKELDRIGYKLPDVDKIDNMEWIPVSLPTIFLIASVKVLNLKREDILKIGKEAVSFKSIFKFYIRYFSSFKKTITRACNAWRKHYSFGEVEIAKCDIKEKILVIRLKDFKKHKTTCIYLEGVFTEIIRMALGEKEISSEETKCIFNGDNYHEYVFKWN